MYRSQISVKHCISLYLSEKEFSENYTDDVISK